MKAEKTKLILGLPIVISFKELTSMKRFLEEEQLISKRKNSLLLYAKSDQKLSFFERLLKLTGVKTSLLDLFTKLVTILL